MRQQNVSMPGASMASAAPWRARPVVAAAAAAASGPAAASAAAAAAPSRQRAAPVRRGRTTAAAPPPPPPVPAAAGAGPRNATETAAAAAGAPCPVDLIEWPEGTRPKRGGLSKAAVLKLKVTDVRRELGRLQQQPPAGASKAELADLLLAAVMAAHAAKTGSDNTQQQQQQEKGGEEKSEEAKVPAARRRRTAAATGATAAAVDAAPKRRTAAKGAEDAATGAAPAAPRKRATKQQHATEEQEGKQQQRQQQQEAHAATEKQPAAPRKRAGATAAPVAAAPPKETPEQRRRRELVLNTVASGSGLDPEKGAAICEASGVKLEDLPPFPQGKRGLSYPSHRLAMAPEEDELVLLNNRTMLMVTFVGTSGETVGTERCAPCVALLRGKDVWLFDAGEDTQRQVFEIEHLRPSKVFRIFVSSLRAERILGLPGLICTVGSAREKGHENADIPVHVYGPPGLADFLASVYQVSSTYVEMPILVHEFTPSPPSPDDGPSLFNRRAKIWRQALPPDQLNPQGYINGALEAFMPTQGRATQRKGNRAAGGPLSFDGRAGFMPLPTPPPGDPSAQVSPGDMTWTIAADQSAMIKVTLLDPEAPPVFGFAVVEPDRVGSISIQRCDALLVPAGGSYGKLKEGESVTNMAGVTIPPEMVVGPVKPGRTVAIAPAASDPAKITDLAQGADLLIADACGGSGSGGGGDLEASVVGVARAAAEAEVGRLVFTGFRSQPMREYRERLAAANGPPPDPDSDDEGIAPHPDTPSTPSARSSPSNQQQQQQQGEDGEASDSGQPEAAAIVPESRALAALKAAARREFPGAVSMAWDGETFLMEKHDGPDAGPKPGPEYYKDMAEDKRQTDCRALALDPELMERKRREAADRAAIMAARGVKRMGPPP